MKEDLKFIKKNLDLEKFLKLLDNTIQDTNERDIYNKLIDCCKTKTLEKDKISFFLGGRIPKLDKSMYEGNFFELVSENFKVLKSISKKSAIYEDRYLYQLIKSKINKTFYITVYHKYDNTNDGYFVTYKSENQKDALIKLKDLSKKPIRYISSGKVIYDETDKTYNELNTDEAIQLAIRNIKELENFPDKFKKDKQVMSAVISVNSSAIKFADESLKKDRSFILNLVHTWSDILKYADKSLRKDKSIVLKAAKNWSSALEFADESLKKDRSFVLELVKQGGFSLFYVDKIFRKDRLIVKEAVTNDGGSLELVDESFKKDKSIVNLAIKSYGTALQYAHSKLKKR